MITEIHFQNFKALRDTTLPLGRMNLLIGPNGSGKSTVLQAVELTAKDDLGGIAYLNIHARKRGASFPGLAVTFECDNKTYMLTWGKHQQTSIPGVEVLPADRLPSPRIRRLQSQLSIRIFAFESHAIAHPSQLVPGAVLGSDGSSLSAVLDRLRDSFPERFETINQEVSRWLPEYDRILFDTPSPGERSIALRHRIAQVGISADDLSQGTLIALAILTLAYLPEPPRIVGLEEPDRGIHPRLLRDIRDAMYRLAYPENFGEKREPVQVIATTHSPIFLDLFRDHPEEIIIANRTEDNVKFERLSERPDLDELLGDASLGEVWYSGVLGGVPDR